MEDRVRHQLEKEHSKRFRAMCHKNENLSQASKTLLEFYDREKKKSLHLIESKSLELKRQLVKYSQEMYVNTLLNQLTDIAFQNNDHDLDFVNQVNSLSSISSEEQDVNTAPRYLRIETNPFHPSEMSLGSSEMLGSSELVLASHDSCEEQEQDTEKEEEIEIVEAEDDGNQKNTSDDAVRKVVDKLTGFYDIEKLKFLTQVMLKTLHTNDRSRYEDKRKLVYNLNRYLTDKEPEVKSASPKSAGGKVRGDSTFLFLKADRQKELRDEASKLSKSKPIKSVHKHKAGERRSSLPILPDLNKMPHSIEKERRFSLAQSAERRHSLPQTVVSKSPAPPSFTSTLDRPAPEDHSTDWDDMMKIYLKLGHGALLKLPRNVNRATVRAKQRSWLRRDLKNIPVVSRNGDQDLRIVMKNCRYLRFPKDMLEDLLS